MTILCDNDDKSSKSDDIESMLHVSAGNAQVLLQCNPTSQPLYNTLTAAARVVIKGSAYNPSYSIYSALIL